MWSQILNATEREVMLVIVGGKARYGDAAIMSKASDSPATTLSVGGLQRKLAISDPQEPARHSNGRTLWRVSMTYAGIPRAH